MLKRLFVVLLLAVVPAAFVSAQSKMTIPVKSTQPDDGKQMYVNYCSSCHGLDGRGHGPTAGALKYPPTDLTLLSKNNGGKYPSVHLVAVLKFGIETAAHGSKEMPVWGAALDDAGHAAGNAQNGQALRINNLVKYVETLQAK